MSTGLSSLLGQYMSDSENEDEQNSSTNNQNITSNLIDDKNENYFSPPITAWTQCVDPVTNHPYYWNIETKEVTWDRPVEYDTYINYVYKNLKSQIPDNCWVIGFTEDNKTPYYVNEYTRVVSWKKPSNFKEPIVKNESNNIEVTTKNLITQEMKLTQVENDINIENEERIVKQQSLNKNSKLHETKKKKQNKTIRKNSKDDNGEDDGNEKIELITSYSGHSSSSEEETNRTNEIQEVKMPCQKTTLVAAYETDDEDDDNDDDDNNNKNINENSNKSQSSQMNKQQQQKLIQTSIEENHKLNESTSVVPIITTDETNSLSNNTNNIQTNSFASIITGGKTDSVIDEEINRLKMELEKELPGFAEQQHKTDEYKTTNENNFDEKMFQRKRRIQFNAIVNTSVKDKQSTIKAGTTAAFITDTEHSQDTENLKKNQKHNLYSNFTRSHIEFGENNSNNNSNSNKEMSTAENCEITEIIKSNDNVIDDESLLNKNNLKLQIEDLNDLIQGKIKFLSVSRPEASTVQVMGIQLETLLTAYRLSSLDPEYFFKWLKTISDDLNTLEQNAAPDGWECCWDRQSSQYFYKNLTTGDIRWEFPIDDNNTRDTTNNKEINQENKENLDGGKQNVIADESSLGHVRGEDEMDISTTPPPNESEQIEFAGNWDAANNAPPPPIISSEPALSADYYSTLAKSKHVDDINCELASFYSDIATLDTVTDAVTAATTSSIQSVSSTVTSSVSPTIDGKNSSPIKSSSHTNTGISMKQTKKTTMIDNNNDIPKKKQKKIKVPSVGQKMKEVSTLVAKWQKVRKELDGS